MKKYENVLLWLSVTLLFFISIINLYNAKFLNSFYNNYYLKQCIWYFLGFLIIIISSKMNFKAIFKYSNIIYLINVLFLLLVLFIGDEINGTKAWIDFKIFTLQPSEFMKISLTLYLIEISQKKLNKFAKFSYLTIITLIPCILVFLEPDTGAIIFYLIIYFYLLTTLKIKWFYYLFLIFFLLGLGLLFIFLYQNQQDLLIKLIGTSFFYRVERIINFKSNYQLELSLLSIFGSPFIRNGFNGILLYIPEGATDFIFAFSIGNFGFFMCPLILWTYLMLLITISFKINNKYNKKTNYLVISFLLILLCQILINIMMNIGIIPIVGITLPFLSFNNIKN